MPEKSITELPATPVSRLNDSNGRQIKVAAYCRVSTSSEEQLSSYNSQKENINTLENDDETLLAIFSALAQAESESLSRNVRMGLQQNYKAGVVPYHVIYGYRKGDDNTLVIVPEEAEIVKRVFEHYLAGRSIGRIRKDLEADGIPTYRGKSSWSENTLQQMLRNEKYCGDVLLQKTYVDDILIRKTKKNTGQFTQYYIQNNHEPIVSRDLFDRVQVEIARRASKTKTPSPSARTWMSKYSGKSALNEILVCGECGSYYRRTTWAKPQGRVGVWRCTSRLEHGDKKLLQAVDYII